jgi:hypothetical protein
MAALGRAIALEQMHQMAVLVAEDLHLDMARAIEVALQDEPAVAEGRFGLAPGALQGCRELRGFRDHPHAAPAAARRGLDQHRIAESTRFLGEAALILRLAMIAGHGRDAGTRHHRFRIGLVADGADRGRARADEDDPGAAAGFGEIGILRQEPVTWMDRPCATRLGCLEHALDRQIAFARGSRPDQPRFVRHLDMHRLGVDR